MLELIVGFLVGFYFKPLFYFVKQHIDERKDCDHK